ncbi:MAG: DUF5107 domain-containing protein [Pirellulaceae bacterium]
MVADRSVGLYLSLFFLAGALLACSAVMATAGEVTVRETTLEIPTYALGPDDKNPPFHNPNALRAETEDAPVYNQNVYPYPMQTDVTGQKAVESYRAVLLENDYIRLIILPELGGRIYAAHDKTNDDFDFIYHNHVIKPSLVALRGAWISGGIEWNFPTRGHTTNTLSPVGYKIIKGEDGSVTCVVGTPEWVRRMKWVVLITVYPDRSCFRTRILLSNPTLTHNLAYFWSNAAVHAWPDTQVIFPPTDHTFAAMRRSPEPWPINHGRDVSWYKNTPFAHDFFCGIPGGYHGAYNSQRDCGTVHTASGYESPGQKFWTWGTAPSGVIWEDLLTDTDGQYIEVQAGRLPTQGDTWIFEPHMRESWDEYWYPVRKLQGFVKANPEAAVNVSLRAGKLFLAANTTREYRDVTLRVLADGRQVLSRKLTIGPRQPWQEEIAVSDKAKIWRLALSDDRGRRIITYETDRKPLPSPDLEPQFPPSQSGSAEEVFLAGYYALKHWKPAGARQLFEEALKKDPGFAPALRMLAILHYQAGDFEKAYGLSRNVLARNEDDHTARYYSALCRIKLGIDERTKDDLHLIGRRAAYRHVAPYVLASLAVAEGDFPGAETLLQRSIRHNPSDLKARTILASVFRHMGRDDKATELVEGVLSEDPIHEMAILETAFLGGGKDELNLLNNDPQYYLEAACGYIEANLLEDAVRALELCQGKPGAREHPFVDFFLGYLADRMGRQDRAESCYEKGLALSPKYVFPFRTESLAVLQTGLRYEPESWKLHYYLGTLLTAKLRWREGLEHFLAAKKASPNWSVLYSNLGTIYWRKLKDVKKAQAAFEKVRACDPDDYHYYIALDRLYAEAGEPAKRETLFSQAPLDVENDFRVRFRHATYYCDMGRYDEALGVLREATFIPWEGFTQVHDLYARVLHLRAGKQAREGNYDPAIKDLRQVMEYPENLGVGKPHNPSFVREYYHLGVYYQALGKTALARRYLMKAAQSPSDSHWNEKAREALRGPNEPKRDTQ